MTADGRVVELWLFPVKSMSGDTVAVADLDAGGLVGDRSWTVADDTGALVTAGREPRLREAVARLVDGDLVLDLPGGATGLDREEADAALSAWLGRAVHLEHRAGRGYVDVAPVHLVSRGSIADVVHAQDCDACDVKAPRANVVLEVATGAGAERGWVGREVEAGSSRLTVVRVPQHCLGVYADVSRRGRLAVGDEVELR